MAGAFTVISTIDDREIVAALDRLRDKAGHLAPALKNIGEELLRTTQQRFLLQKDPQGNRWASLKDSTKAAKAARGYNPRKILTMRGHLADTIRYQANENRMRVGTNRIYGAIHQFGGEAGRGGTASIPARPFLGVSRSDTDRILEIVADHLEMKTR